MSRIYFSTETAEAAVRGSERAFAGVMASDICVAIIRASVPDDVILSMVPEGHYLLQFDKIRALEQFGSWFRVNIGGERLRLADGESIDPFTLSLNTAIAVGSDPLRLLARLHGQCEIHAYAEEANREWLAGIVQAGMSSGLCRKDAGWEAVVELLLGDSRGPVVTSYSVCEGFPNETVAGWESVTEDDWYELPEAERWAKGIEGLRSRPKQGLEMKPGNWKSFWFGDAPAITAMNLRDFAPKEDTPS